MDKKKGIKRHETLYPLSHHHHDALFLALKLRRAGTEKSQLSVDELKNEVNQFWEPGGQQHFREEEEILLPAYAEYESIDQPEIKEMLLEHVMVRSLVRKIQQADTGLEPIMRELGELLEAHVRKEERIIFPMVEKALPEQVLVELEPHWHR
ncbi:hemerythrin domain-containing protein [Aquibacillus sediminis]|uniref:hemerythrin domain-containing protein n=1 Tax=Aquibacillus sediminis TaxID=2574734 RepID=UPI001FE33DBF|nr:hemerythrin domain-containing protein [Aquibacillus sediminis]